MPSLELPIVCARDTPTASLWRAAPRGWYNFYTLFDTERSSPDAIQAFKSTHPPPVQPNELRPGGLLAPGKLPSPGPRPVTNGRNRKDPMDDDQRDHLQPLGRDGSREPCSRSRSGIASSDLGESLVLRLIPFPIASERQPQRCPHGGSASAVSREIENWREALGRGASR